jgi:hypothetical protein
MRFPELTGEPVNLLDQWSHLPSHDGGGQSRSVNAPNQRQSEVNW